MSVINSLFSTKKNEPEFGPTLPISKEIWKTKYSNGDETFEQAMERIAGALSDSPEHKALFHDIILNQRFLPAGRVQAGAGAPKAVTLHNCFVMGTIPDSMDGILDAAKEAGMTMRMGGGVGMNFGTLRPRGELIKGLDSKSSGPVSFMGIWDAVCKTIASAGHRRGAMMAVMPCDHPDVFEFIRAKRNSSALTGFNISVACTDEFMNAVKEDKDFNLKWGGTVYKTIRARELWDEIMMSTWDWAEPGVLFIDRINKMNNLWYCEQIKATNPCGEQPLGPYAACLLGSFNIVKYVDETSKSFDWKLFTKDIPHVVRAMDIVNDVTMYPLEAQKQEALAKRRMGLGVTGMANALEFMGLSYGSEEYLNMQSRILDTLKNLAYQSSALLAKEKGSFPLFDKEKYLMGEFIKTLRGETIEMIRQFGIRNSHLTSIAPTGTISLSSDNISSGIEPVFSLSYTRTIQTFEGPKHEDVKDYGFNRWGLRGKTANECSVDEHLAVLLNAQQHVDSAISKTCNVGNRVTFEEFKDIYMKAYEGGAKGVTTFRAAGKRYGILNEKPLDNEPKNEDNLKVEDKGGTPKDTPEACFIDAKTGIKTCE